MPVVIALIRAELLKLRTTQVWLWLLVGDIALGALVAVASLASSGAVRSPADVPEIFATANGALLTAFVLGVLGITTEFRHQTITSTVLVTPTRSPVMAAKVITYAAVGVLYALACLTVQLAIVLPWLSARRIAFRLTDPTLLRALLGLPVVFALFAVMGVGIGPVLRNQTLAVTLGLLFLLVVQNLISAIPGVRAAWAYTPAGATTAVLFPRHHTGPGDARLLPPAGGLAALVVWAFAPAVLGAAIAIHHDIT